MKQERENYKVDNASYNNDWYDPGGSPIKIRIWYLVNALFFINPLNPFVWLKVWLLRVFGAQVGVGVVIKPGVNIKYPWRLTIADHAWIGEKVWIDNLADVSIGANSCISQGAMLLTGNHDFSKTSFDLILGSIVIEDGAWIGAKSVVTPGVTCGSHSVLTVCSVATKDLDAYSIYQGNPAKFIRKRNIIS